MSGVPMIVRLLLGEPGVTALVPADRIVGGVIPLGAHLPAIGVTSVSAVPLGTVALSAAQHWTERVQVTVLAKSEPQAGAVWRALVAIDRKVPVIAGVTEISVVLADFGGDFTITEAAIRGNSQDFRVGYNLPT